MGTRFHVLSPQGSATDVVLGRRDMEKSNFLAEACTLKSTPRNKRRVARVSPSAHPAVLAATGGTDLHVGDAEHALQRPLSHGHVLHVGEGHRLLVQPNDAFANSQAAVRDDVPALLEVQAQEQVRACCIGLKPATAPSR